MKKSFAITTIIALHAALIGGMLIQGCSSEPAETQPAKAKTTVEEINPAQPEEQAQPAAAETMSSSSSISEVILVRAGLLKDSLSARSEQDMLLSNSENKISFMLLSLTTV